MRRPVGDGCSASEFCNAHPDQQAAPVLKNHRRMPMPPASPSPSRCRRHRRCCAPPAVDNHRPGVYAASPVMLATPRGECPLCVLPVETSLSCGPQPMVLAAAPRLPHIARPDQIRVGGEMQPQLCVRHASRGLHRPVPPVSPAPVPRRQAAG